MDYLPEELVETQLDMQVVLDPDTKCLTMTTVIEDCENTGTLTPDVTSNDPLFEEEPDFEQMSELDQLIYFERQRIVNLKKLIDETANRAGRARVYDPKPFEGLSKKMKCRMRMRRLRDSETEEERELRRFRHRMNTTKSRLLLKLKNFENDSLLKEMSKRNVEKVQRNRLQLKETLTPEEKAQRRKESNKKHRLRVIRSKAFQTAEEILAEKNHNKEKRNEYLQKHMSSMTEEELIAHRKAAKDKSKERYTQTLKEWRTVEKIAKGAIASNNELVVQELIDKI